MSADTPTGRLILDTGGLLAWAHGDVKARGVIRDAERRRLLIVVSAVVIAQAIRGGAGDAAVNWALRKIGMQLPVTPALARQAGALLGATGTTDVVDAIVVAEAVRFLPATILTSDPRDIHVLVAADPARGRVRVVAI
jgi:hypothetical protein